jgi:hypothetical protein
VPLGGVRANGSLCPRGHVASLSGAVDGGPRTKLRGFNLSDRKTRDALGEGQGGRSWHGMCWQEGQRRPFGLVPESAWHQDEASDVHLGII